MSEESTALLCMPPPRRCFECRTASSTNRGAQASEHVLTPNPLTPRSHSLFSLLFLVRCCIWRAHILIPPAADTAGAFAAIIAVVFADAAVAVALATSLVNEETGWVGVRWLVSQFDPPFVRTLSLALHRTFLFEISLPEGLQTGYGMPWSCTIRDIAVFGLRFRFPIVARAH